MVRVRVLQRKRQADAEDSREKLLDPDQSRTDKQSEFMQPGCGVSCFVEFLMEPGCLVLLGVSSQCFTAAGATLNCFIDGFRSQHPGLHCGVSTFLLQVVKETRVVPNQKAARHGQLWQGRMATFDNSSRAVCDPLAAFKILTDVLVVLPALEFLKRAQVWVLVIEVDDQAECYLVVFEVIEV